MAYSITSKGGRARLPARGEPYWAKIKPAVALGYRKAKVGAGAWVLRSYRRGRYEQDAVGTADDVEEANGKAILDYGQAVQAALDLHYIAYEPGPKGEADYTVEQASKDYLKELKRQGRKATALHDAELTINAHILPALGTVQVRYLTTRDLKRWRDALLIGRALPKQKPDDEVKQRDRKHATVNRIWTTLRALLSLAFTDEHVATDAAWRRIKPFKGVEVPRQRFLTVAEAKALLAACSASFRDLAHAALTTGCRLGELLALNAGEFDPVQGSLHIAQSKSGHPRDVVLTEEGVALFARLTEAKEEAALLFPGWTGKAHVRPMRRAVAAAKLPGNVTFHTLRHTWASLAVMNGTPLVVVARNLGHRDTRMVEQVYGHLSKSYVADETRKGAPRFS